VTAVTVGSMRGTARSTRADSLVRGVWSASWLPPVLGVLALLTAWTLAAALGGAGHHVIPFPSDVVRTLVDDGFYTSSLAVTGREALWGFASGALAAVFVGAACVLVPRSRGVLMQLAAASYCAPAVAIGPLLVVFVDQDSAKIIISALSVFFLAVAGIVLGLSSAPRGALELVHTVGGGSLFALVRVRLRAAVPAASAGLALSAPAALLGAIIGEYLGGEAGLGVAMVQAQQAMEVSRTWALALLATAVSALAYLAIATVARRLDFTVVTSELPGSGRGTTVKLRRGLRAATGAGKVALGLAAVWLLWTVAVTALGLDRYFAKTPGDVLAWFTDAAKGGQHRRTILDGLGTTLGDAAEGYVLGTVLAVTAAVAMVVSRFTQAMFFPIALALRSVPLVAMTPLICLVFGRGFLGVTVLAATITFVPTLVNVASGLRQVPAPAQELLHAYGVSWWRATFGVRLVYALPSLATSARIAIPGALLGAVLAEFLATGEGLGQLIALSSINSDFPTLWAAVTVVTGVSVGLYSLLVWLENTTLRRLTSS
jgi:sulfonate transport system permease protein